MKKTLLVIGAIFLVILISLAAVPFIFKNQIKSGIDAAIAESVQADVSYENFNLSLLSTFPHLSISADNIGVIGHELFLSDTLLYTQQAQIRIDLKSVLLGDQITIKSIDLESPQVLIKILDDGTANYDIAVSSTDSLNEESGSYDLKINHWKINNGAFTYDDQQLKFYLELNELAHEGSGDFNAEVFDLDTHTDGRISDLNYDGISYVSDKHLLGDVTLEMNLLESRYTFKENKVSLNEFAFGFDGWISLDDNSDDISMELSFAAQQNDFQSLLSCVPGMYTEGFGDITSEGQVQFSGSAVGIYNDSRIPVFNLDFKIAEGMFQYPNLPQAVKNINMDVTVANKSGALANTLIDIKKMHLDFGQNPVDGRIRLDGLGPSEVDADVQAHINLTEITQMIPMEGTTLKGNFDLSLSAQGTYDSTLHQFPKVAADMALKEGYVKSDQFPEALDQFNFVASVKNPSGSMEATLIEVPKFDFIMDGAPFSGNLVLKNLDDYQWDLFVDGSLDLEKLTKVFPVEGTTLVGLVKGNLATKGKMSDLEAERYQLLPTSGNVEIANFTYQDQDLAHPFNVETGKAIFDPRMITIEDVNANTGSSDMQLQGTLTNYINYVFKENEVLKGKLDLVSNKLDLNEWMTETADTTNAAPLEVLEIPKTIDLNITSNIGTLLYDNLTLSKVKGKVNVQQGMATMEDVTFNSLGGQFALSGNYDSRDLKHPKFDFDLGMVDVAVKEAFNTFNTVQILAPVAKLVDGDFSSSFNLSGELGQNMMPLLNTLSGGGLVQILEAALAGVDSKIVQGLNSLTNFSKKADKFNLKDVIMQFQIKNGKLNLKPFDVTFGDYLTKVSGSTGIDGSVEFLLNMEVPAGVVGASVNQAISKLTGSDEPTDDIVKLNINLGGTYKEPTFALGGREGGATTTSLAKDAVNQKVDEAKDSVKAVVDENTQEFKEQGQAQLDSLINNQIKDSASNELIKEVKDNIFKDKSVDDVLNIFKKKKKQTADSTGNQPR